MPSFELPELTGADPAIPIMHDYDAEIGAVSYGSAAWARPEKARVTQVAGTPIRVSAIADLAAAGKTLVQATANKQPAWAEGVFNGQPGLTFSSNRNDFLSVANLFADVSGDLGWIGLVKPTTIDANPHHIFQIGGSQRLRLFHTQSTFTAQCGGLVDTVNQAASVSVAPAGFGAGWYITMVGWDGVAKIVYLSLDGGASWAASPANLLAPAPNTATYYLGAKDDGTQGFGGQLVDGVPLNFNPAKAANADRLALEVGYFYNYWLLPA